MTRSTAIAVVLFAGLAIAAAALLIAASAVNASFARTVLIQMGCVVFGSGLTIFALRLFSAADHR
jgi:Na+/phosphate symporter